MSTNDVPGARSANADELAMGCWAEHEDGSMIFVESVEGGRVIYSIFDLEKDPPMEYRDAMPERGFKQHFSWDPQDPDSEKWTWHDKTPFPWDRIIDSGIGGGQKYPTAQHQLTAAQRVADDIGARGKPVDPDNFRHLVDKLTAAGEAVRDGIQGAIDRLGT